MTKHDRCFLSSFVPFLKSIIKKTQNTKVFILYFKAHTISCSGILLREKLERNQRWHLKTSKSTLLFTLIMWAS